MQAARGENEAPDDADAHGTADTDAHGVRPVKSAERTLQVLEYLAGAGGSRSLRDIQRDLGLPRSSTYALLLTMARQGWVEADPSGSRFRLGMRALLTGASYVEHDDLVQRTTAAMDDLNLRLGETIHLARLEGAEIVYLATRPSRHSLGILSRPGRRLPAYVTGLGKVMLSERSRAEVEQLLPATLEARTPNTITDRDAFHAELARTRDRGYALDVEESTQGVRCFAIGLHRVVPAADAPSCSVPAVRVTPGRDQEILTELLAARRDLRL